jgi:fatty acid desaturase
VARAAPSDYVSLKREIRAAGLLERQPGYYVLRAASSLLLLAAALVFVLTADTFAVVLLASVILGAALGQAASFTHDAGHRAILRPGSANDAVGLFFGNVIGGVSWSWWCAKHNAHHAHPNDPDLDPDANLRLLAFTQDQARTKRGIARWIVRHQAALFLLMLPFEAFHFQGAGIKQLLRRPGRYRSLELILLAARTVALISVFFIVLPPGLALTALFVSNAAFGLYFGLIFAPNHKGMPMAPDADYLRRQVVTARNVRPNAFLDFWFIGLNYQIEHHLFPSLPRNRLRAARQIVRRFCQERGVPYVEVGFFRSLVEVLKGLSEASAGAGASSKESLPDGVGAPEHSR